MSVKIDKYVSIIDKSGLIGWIRDESNERVIIKINMDTKENTKKMLDMCLDALNTGAFEPVEEGGEPNDASSTSSDSSSAEQNNDGSVSDGVDNAQTGDGVDDEMQG